MSLHTEGPLRVSTVPVEHELGGAWPEGATLTFDQVVVLDPADNNIDTNSRTGRSHRRMKEAT